MTNDSWLLLEKRLRAMANNKASGGCDGVVKIDLVLYIDDSSHLIGWQKPERVIFEPKQFPLRFFRLQSVNNWQSAIDYMRETRLKGEVKHSLVICDGNPRGYVY